MFSNFARLLGMARMSVARVMRDKDWLTKEDAQKAAREFKENQEMRRETKSARSLRERWSAHISSRQWQRPRQVSTSTQRELQLCARMKRHWRRTCRNDRSVMSLYEYISDPVVRRRFIDNPKLGEQHA